ncbi:hypothetical protein EJB05_52421, partial [Eragrostis curvula]
MATRSSRLSLAILLVLGADAGLCAAQDYDFFYLVLQWPGSYCDTKQSCCYPKSGKPAADFGIHGLWPNRDDGRYPRNCNPDSYFFPGSDLLSSLRAHWPVLACPSNDGVRYWGQARHRGCGQIKDGTPRTCAAHVLGALTLGQIKDAIRQGTGFEPYVECNSDESGNSQLLHLYFCVDAAGSHSTSAAEEITENTVAAAKQLLQSSETNRVIECPVLPHVSRIIGILSFSPEPSVSTFILCACPFNLQLRWRCLPPAAAVPRNSPASEARDWATLPHDALLEVFLRPDARDIMWSTEVLCKAWHRVTVEEPMLWRRVDMTAGPGERPPD